MNWKRIEARYEEIDNATYGLAEFVVVGSGGALLAIILYFILAAVFWGYLQLFSLATGGF
jgi:hypothetical protein